MSNKSLNNRRVAVLATDGFEQAELEKPVEALKAAGAVVEVVSPKTGRSKAGTIRRRATPRRSIVSSRRPTPARMTPWCCLAA